MRNATDAYECFPDAACVDAIERGFLAAERAYRLAYASESVTGHLRSPEFDGIVATIPEFGDAAGNTLAFYSAKARSDRENHVGAKDYTPWIDLGLFIPSDSISFETHEDGTDWLRIGSLSPIHVGLGEAVPYEFEGLLLSKERTGSRRAGRAPMWRYSVLFIHHSYVRGLL